MVGVPGRSKGCHTCRKRKKKCDLQRPACGNCARGNFACAGYDRDMIIVQVDRRGKGTYQQQQQNVIVPYMRPANREMSLADVRYRHLNRTAFEVECLAGLQYLLTPRCSFRDVSMYKSPLFLGEWWSVLHEYAPRSDLIKCSILSMSAYHVGHTKRDAALRHKGLELFGEAMRNLSKALEASRFHGQSSMAFDIEMTCYTVGLQEFLRQELPEFEEQDPSWARFRKYYDRDQIRFSSRVKGHMKGLVSLFELQGPETYAEPKRHQLFSQLRQTWLPLCLESRQGTYLGTEEWLTKPWRGRRKAYYDTMWDAIAPLPGLLEKWDILRAASPGRDIEERALLLRRQYHDLNIKFEEWHNNLSTACFSFTQEDAKLLRKEINSLDLEDLPEVLVVQSPWLLFAWMMHWAGRILLYSTAPLLYLRFPPMPDECIITPPASIGTYCLSIARSVKYFFQPDQVGLMLEMGMRLPVTFVQKALSDPILRATGDPKLDEAESVLLSIGLVDPGMAIDEVVAEAVGRYARDAEERGLSLVQYV